MTPQHILRSARIEELRANVNRMAELARPAPVIEIKRTASRRSDDHRRLLLLLARERRRSARLVAELVKL